jgi:Uri superfamily endonuclease
MNCIESRVRRHLSKEKKLHWHIDYLLERGNITSSFYMKGDTRLECHLARGLAQGFESVRGFGSSDCRCKSHLFLGTEDELLKRLSDSGMSELIF